MTTRGEILDDAYDAIGLADWVFTLTADEQAKGFRALDTMMATKPWSGLTYVAGGNAPSRSDVTGTAVEDSEAISANLSLRLAPGFGKTVSGEQRRIARDGLNRVTAKTFTVPQSARIPIRVRSAGDWWRGWFS